MTRTIRALLDYGVERFEAAGLSYGHGTANALDEATWLILHSLGLPLDELNPHLDEPLTEATYRAAKSLLDLRVRSRKPAAYLTHEAWLGKLKFYVDERVIVPRSFIAELLRGQTPNADDLRGLSPNSILDLCTGSGCLAILAALTWPNAKVDAADLSSDALAVARRNIADYKLARRVRLVKSDLFSALPGKKYDLIISNPPYVKASSMRKLPDEYRKEPGIALASGVDGLDHTRRILAKAKEHLNPEGLLVVEIGHNRSALERAFPKLALEWPRVSAGTGYVFTIFRERIP
ncbi:MAG: 50S ribosomal protein L3 N(5)-glutamine methyltransferase [Usitatibacter sp.]